MDPYAAFQKVGFDTQLPNLKKSRCPVPKRPTAGPQLLTPRVRRLRPERSLEPNGVNPSGCGWSMVNTAWPHVAIESLGATEPLRSMVYDAYNYNSCSFCKQT